MAVASLFEDLLDQYKIEQHIAEKRYTDLYQACDVDDDSPVRLEVLRAEYAGDSSFVGRFVSRARAIAQMRHSNIAPILHIGKTTNGAPYVAQSVIDGYPLSHRLEQLSRRKTPANPIYALNLVRQLGDALTLAERLELFHYDLQPDNVLLKNVTLPTDDSVVLMDLFIPVDKRIRGNGSSGDSDAGSYLSPEQRAGKEVTAASHVYSLGAMLYRLLAGKTPGGPVTLRDVGLKRFFGRASALERERGDLAPATYDLIERSMRRDPHRRFPDVEAFNVALGKALAAEEVRPGAVATRDAGGERRPLIRLLPLMIVTLFLAVGVVAMGSLVNRNGGIGNGSTSQTIAVNPAQTESAGGVVAIESTATMPLVTGEGDQVTRMPAGSPAVVEAVATTTPAEGAVTQVVDPQGGGPQGGATLSVTTQNVVTQNAATQEAIAGTPEVTPTPTESSALTPTIMPTTALPRVRVTLNLVNLRRGPGVSYSLLGNVAAGENLEVIAWNNDKENPWYLVLTDDQRIGWIAATVVEAVSAEALAAVPVAATIPPTPRPTLTPTPTPTYSVVVTIILTNEPGGPGEGGSTRPPEEPTTEPTEPPDDPTRTPPPFTPSP